MSALQWLIANRQWGKALNLAHARYKLQSENERRLFWNEVIDLLTD
jgi:hypothetical protein